MYFIITYFLCGGFYFVGDNLSSEITHFYPLATVYYPQLPTV